MIKFLIVLLFVSFVHAQENVYTEQRHISDNDILSMTWIDDFFLTKRIFLYPALIEHMEDIGINIEQLEEIRDFYRKNLPLMLDKAKKAQEIENELHDLVLHGGEAKRIKELIIELAKIKAELTVYNVKEVRTIQNILTTDQYEILLDYINQK